MPCDSPLQMNDVSNHKYPIHTKLGLIKKPFRLGNSSYLFLQQNLGYSNSTSYESISDTVLPYDDH